MYYKTRKEEERRRRLERLLERIDLMVALSTCCFSKAAAFRAVILGAPASGKGTISLRIIEHFNIMHISSGDKLRLHVKNNTGFPRTLTQAEKLQRIQPANLVLNLIVPTSVILNRVKNRWVHLPSGRIYNIGFNDPKVPGKDDVTGESLSQREDDKPEVVHRRLEEYSAKTKPVVDFYCNLGILKNFRGDTTDDIWPSIKECVKQFL
ncbi:GTP:AMP phosphotransferase AK3, mitochondrial-like isoform X2 [Vespa mandarinia]|uniref:GTP:AMP phosphotransferase AK3, mitochondrial-like isoform X2 n=1 Tax=Vespa mandarinia TaxID=7446 RepID=UPI001616AAA4|nr:GTP:AMP phosphotransferase AK3, mitochondrial-like isoform X2 [Vespa mandarinia]